MKTFGNMLCEEFPPAKGACDCEVCKKFHGLTEECSAAPGTVTSAAAGNVSAQRDKHRKKEKHETGNESPTTGIVRRS